MRTELLRWVLVFACGLLGSAAVAEPDAALTLEGPDAPFWSRPFLPPPFLPDPFFPAPLLFGTKPGGAKCGCNCQH